jgi:hypothetical protein
MSDNISEKYIEEWKNNLLPIKDFSKKYPSLYTLSQNDWNVLKYIDSSNEEYLIWMSIKWNISLFLDITWNFLDSLEENALIELHKTKIEVNNEINKILQE